MVGMDVAVGFGVLLLVGSGVSVGRGVLLLVEDGDTVKVGVLLGLAVAVKDAVLVNVHVDDADGRAVGDSVVV